MAAEVSPHSTDMIFKLFGSEKEKITPSQELSEISEAYSDMGSSLIPSKEVQ